MNWKEYLHIPLEARVSMEARDLIRCLIRDPESRLGSKKGSLEIKQHPFFNAIDWRTDLRAMEAPHQPVIDDLGLCNFDHFDDDDDEDEDDGGRARALNGGGANGEDDQGRHSKDYIGFYEFTFRRFFDGAGYPLPLRLPGQEEQQQEAVAAVGEEAAAAAAAAPPDPVYV